jgi:hypothetical protein
LGNGWKKIVVSESLKASIFVKLGSYRVLKMLQVLQFKMEVLEDPLNQPYL